MRDATSFEQHAGALVGSALRQATDHWNETTTSSKRYPPHIPFPCCRVFATYRGKILTGDEIRTIGKHQSSIECNKYISKRLRITAQESRIKAWQCRSQALSGLPKNITTYVTKASIRWLPVGERQHRLDPTRPASCLMCGAVETQVHLLQCQHYNNWRQEFLTKFASHLTTTNARSRLA